MLAQMLLSFLAVNRLIYVLAVTIHDILMTDLVCIEF